MMNGDEAARLVIDNYSAQIIFATDLRAKSAQTLSQGYGIPIAACYRRIKSLESIGVLVCTERFLNQKGKWVRLYQSKVREMDVRFEEGRMRVNITFRDGRTSEIGSGVITPSDETRISEFYRP
jgi:hypothetical protein